MSETEDVAEALRKFKETAEIEEAVRIGMPVGGLLGLGLGLVFLTIVQAVGLACIGFVVGGIGFGSVQARKIIARRKACESDD